MKETSFDTVIDNDQEKVNDDIVDVLKSILLELKAIRKNTGIAIEDNIGD